jgi:hypothetical protein
MNQAIAKVNQIGETIIKQANIEKANLKNMANTLPAQGGMKKSKEQELKEKMDYSGGLKEGVTTFNLDSKDLNGALNSVGRGVGLGSNEGMERISLGTVDPSKLQKGASSAKVVIPAGSQAKATLLYGAHAPVGGQPAPMLFRVDDLFLGPNGSSVPLKDVMIIGKAVGQKAKERAIVEVVSISGVTPRGVSFNVSGGGGSGYVIGPDAMAGIKGKLFDAPPGFFLKYTGMGMLQAGASALVESTTTTETDINGRQFSNIKPGKVATNAAYSGLSGAISKTADLFSRRLEAWEELVEVDANQQVVVVLLKPVIIEELEVTSGDEAQTIHYGLY